VSADNWTICPRCAKLALGKKLFLSLKAAESYGKVSEDEYWEMLDDIQPLTNPGNTLREDYEIGIYDGVFDVSYRGHCPKCGFTKEFTHTETLEL